MSWLDKLKDYAPSIMAAVVSGGATLPQLALKALSDATGVDIKDEAQAKDIIDNATPEQMIKIKQADNAFKIRMRELDNELVDTELKDIQNARANGKHSIMPAIICCYLTLSVSAFVAALLTLDIPAANVRLIDILFGSYLTAWLSSVAYWVGTTRSSAEKSKGSAK